VLNKIKMKSTVFTYFLLLLMLISCNRFESADIMQENNKSLDTISSLTDMKTNKVIWNDHGIFRTVTLEESNDPKEIEEENENKATCSNNFSGVDRAAAKTSFSSASQTTHYAFNTFRNTLQTDTYMRSIGIVKSSNRVSQENRNIYITTSYLYAIKQESDGDLHMIIGDPSNVALTNCEASGNPSSSSSSYTKIKAVKDAIVSRFGTDFCGKSSYTIFSPPILIDKFNGSLFFDIDHAAGTVGPTGYRPTTAWEVHPISFIQF
jgi:hypothetical protein